MSTDVFSLYRYGSVEVVSRKAYRLADALHQAVESNNVPVVEWLIANGGDVNELNEYRQTPLGIALRNGYGECIKLLANREDIDEWDHLGFAMLHSVASVESISALIELGANVNIEDKNGQTPLIWAVGRGNLPAVALLLRNGARITPEALHHAIHRGSEHMVKAMIARYVVIEEWGKCMFKDWTLTQSLMVCRQ